MHSLSGIGDYTFEIPGSDVIQCALEVTLRALQAGIGLIFIGLQVRVDELDEAVEVLGGDSFVLLIEVVDVTVEDLDEEFDGDRGVHAGVCDAESPLQTFQDAFAVAVKLSGVSKEKERLLGVCGRTFLESSSPRCGFSTTHQRWLARYTARH